MINKLFFQTLFTCLLIGTQALPSRCSDLPVKVEFLNSESFKVDASVIQAYAADTQLGLQSNWFPPETNGRSTTVYFKLRKDGLFEEAKISQPSGADDADVAALKAVEENKFQPLPDGLMTLQVNAKFNIIRPISRSIPTPSVLPNQALPSSHLQ